MKNPFRIKVLSIIMAMIFAFSLCSCKSTKEQIKDKQTSTAVTAKPTAVTAKPTAVAAEETSVKEKNLISNGDFSNGLGKWTTFLQGGEATLTVNANGQLEVKIANMGSVDYGVQAYLDQFPLYQGCEYKMSFDIASSVARDVEWRIQINGGDYHAYVSEVLPLTNKPLHYEKTFVMEEASDPAPRLCFNMGVRPKIKDIGEHTVTIDNLELYLTDDSNKVVSAAQKEKPNINLNQIGFQTNDVKSAVFRGNTIDTDFNVINVDTGEIAYKGSVSKPSENMNTGENDAVGDFSDLKTPGTYKIKGEKCGESYEFVIKDDAYDKVYSDLIKMLYLQRCGCKLSKKTAGEFAHPACHSSKAVIYGTKTKIDVSGGWHDAGDYGRYVVSGAKAVADLLLAYEENPSGFNDDTGISDSGNGTADILDEVKYELDWMLKMQNKNSGGVYHKVTCANFPGAVMPQEEKDQLIVAPISNCATGDFAAVAAMAARVYQKINSKFASKCLIASKKALKYLSGHASESGFKNPSEIVTGEYGDTINTDEQLWALAELYKTTGDKTFESKLKKLAIKGIPMGLGWDHVGLYGVYTYLTCPKTDRAFAGKLKKVFDNAIDDIITKAEDDEYYSTLGDNYNWGSNMGIADNGMLLIMANRLDLNKKYLNMAQKQRDYLFGENANSYCFVTGYGSLSPSSTHHRPSQSLRKTMPGMLVGGPNCNLEDSYAQATLKDAPKAKCYVDNEQSYSCNEVTVYWNSPLIYLLTNLKEK